MTQTDPDYTDEDNGDDEGDGLVGDLRRQLRAAKKEAKDARGQAQANESAARRVAFLDAGIPDTGPNKFFRDKYDGELTPEAIKSAASEYGFLADEDHSDELGEVAQQSQAAQGAEGPTLLGSQEQYEADIDTAVKNAPRGGESKAIADVVAKYNRQV